MLYTHIGDAFMPYCIFGNSTRRPRLQSIMNVTVVRTNEMHQNS